MTTSNWSIDAAWGDERIGFVANIALDRQSGGRAGRVSRTRPHEQDHTSKQENQIMLAHQIQQPARDIIHILGNYSVHTSAEALRQGEAEIRRIG
jgi:hypothetical protein